MRLTTLNIRVISKNISTQLAGQLSDQALKQSVVRIVTNPNINTINLNALFRPYSSIPFIFISVKLN